MDTQVDQLTVKKYFHHILDKNQSFLSAAVQQRRLTEMSNRIANKMELIDLEMTQLAQLIAEFKTVERIVKNNSGNLNNQAKAAQSQTSLADIAQRRLIQEIDQLERMYLLLSKKASADPKQLDRIATRIDTAKKRVAQKNADKSEKTEKNPQLS